jgi:hypothetical protein
MAKIKKFRKQGFTLVEIIVAVAMIIIVALGVAVVLVNSTRAYQVTYDKVYADVVTDAFFVRRLFDSVIRKSSTSGLVLGDDGESVEVRYYSDGSAGYLDRYARFFKSDTELIIENGALTEEGDKELSTNLTVCRNVTNCKFVRSGSNVRMVLRLDDTKKINLVVTSAKLNN